MNKKSFFWGVLTGIVLTLAVLIVIALAKSDSIVTDSIQYLDQPTSYENKKETSFKVFQVLGDAALASEASDKIGGVILYNGKTVVIKGKNFYDDQVVTIKNPQRVGTFNYLNNGGNDMTVPVIDGEIK
jgi:hypothetical protein